MSTESREKLIVRLLELCLSPNLPSIFSLSESDLTELLKRFHSQRVEEMPEDKITRALKEIQLIRELDKFKD